MATERDTLLKEVHEELRREQFEKIWQQYGTYIIGAIVALLLGVGGYKWWESRSIADAEAAGLRFEEALNLTEAGKTDDAHKAFSTIASGSRSNYALLAQLALAGEAVKSGKTESAIAAYDAAASKAGDALIKDFARLQSVSLKIDSIDFTEAQNRLNDLIADNNPWRFMARELLGVAAVRSGRLDDARNVLAPLSADPRAPAAVRDRAGALMNLVVSAELERTAPAKVELEKTDTPAVAPSQPEPPRAKTAPPAKGAVKTK